jgi:hypothetical protein
MTSYPWDVTWHHSRNAVALASEVAARAITRNTKALRDEIRFVVGQRLKTNCDERLHSFSTMPESYRRFRERYRETDPALYVFKLVDLTAALWNNPERKIRKLYGWGARTGVVESEITALELEHRFDDLDPDGTLDRKHRLAFEAAWLAGQHQFAKRLIRDALGGYVFKDARS